MTRQKGKTKKKRKDYQEDDIPLINHDGIIRVPRPLGITYALTLARQKTSEEDQTKAYHEIRDRLIELYVNNEMYINGKLVKVNEFAHYLNMRPKDLMIQMNKEIERMSNFFDGKEGNRLARVLFFSAQKKSLEILAQVANQANILMAQQGTKYVPFLTGEVNRSLANLVAAQKPTHDLLKLLLEKNQTNPLSNENGKSATSAQQYISPEQAREMITQMGPSIYMNVAMIQDKEQTLIGLPNVNARDQDLTGIGVRHQGHAEPTKVPERVPNEVLNDDDFVA